MSDHYKCRHCRYRWPKKDAKISGWDSVNSPYHVHCPRCGKKIAIGNPPYLAPIKT